MTSLLPTFHGGDRGLGGAVGVVDREVGQLDAERQLVLLVGARRGLDEANVVKDHLALVHGALVEHLGGDVSRRQVQVLAARLFEDGVGTGVSRIRRPGCPRGWRRACGSEALEIPCVACQQTMFAMRDHCGDYIGIVNLRPANA
jgi:hypothetical protein